MKCFVAQHGVWVGRGVMPPCDGALVRAHLIKAQVIRRELKLEKNDPKLWDQALWVWVCGGPLAARGHGSGGHHAALDFSRNVRIPRLAIPEVTERWAQAHGLGWWLEREYGELFPDD